MSRNVADMAGLMLELEGDVGPHQRAVERITATLAQPLTLYTIVAVITLWPLGNLACGLLGLYVPDPPPFRGLQSTGSLTALLVTTSVLISQRRQTALTAQRMHVDLQVGLLAEQKAAKVIALLEELRRDLPNVRDRYDAEADALQHGSRPADLAVALTPPE